MLKTYKPKWLNKGGFNKEDYFISSHATPYIILYREIVSISAIF